MNTKRIALDAVLTALALAIFTVEQLIVIPIPVPGVKLGLSNVVTLFAVFAVSPIDAGIILALRIGLGSIFSGSVTGFLFSLSGGLLCYIVTVLLSKIIKDNQIWICGIFGAIAHSIGQIFAAYFIMGTAEIFIYLPVLVACSVLTGGLTGSLSQLSTVKLKKIFPFLPFDKKTKK